MYLMDLKINSKYHKKGLTSKLIEEGLKIPIITITPNKKISR